MAQSRIHKTSFSARLRAKLDLAYSSDGATLLPKRSARAWLVDYLLTTHSIIRSSVPLMRAAHEQCSKVAEQGKLEDEIGKYYKKHIQEEMNHDEWLLDDLESIGVSRKEALLREPSREVAELVGSQYYWIYHWHPVCLLGYIAFLEGNPPQVQWVNKLKEITGYPDTAFRTILKHSSLDPYHRDDLNALLDSLLLTEKQEQWITSNALYAASKLIDITSKAAAMR